MFSTTVGRSSKYQNPVRNLARIGFGQQKTEWVTAKGTGPHKATVNAT